MWPIEPVCSATWTPSLGKRHLRGDLLVKDWLISELDLTAALEAQRERGTDATLSEVLVEQRVISEKQLQAALDRDHKKYRLGDLLVETGGGPRVSSRSPSTTSGRPGFVWERRYSC